MEDPFPKRHTVIPFDIQGTQIHCKDLSNKVTNTLTKVV